MKIKTINFLNNEKRFNDTINTFIENKIVIDIKYSILMEDDQLIQTVLIMYE